jgi:phosphatidylglycerol:prolipoprotein diacylglycerol transferase
MLNHFPGLDWPTPYGAMLALACIAAWWFARHRAAASGIDASHVDLLVPLLLAGGWGGSLLMAQFVPQDKLVAGHASPSEELLRLQALILVGLPAVWAYARIAGAPLRRLADAIAPAALLWLGVMRIGCVLAGCCFGEVAEGLPWALTFPAGSHAYRQQLALGLIAPGAPAALPVHPVQLYESAAALLLCLAVLRLETARLRPGLLALISFAGYAAIAFAVQFFAADSVPLLGPINAIQLLSLGWIAAAALALALVRHARPAATG